MTIPYMAIDSTIPTIINTLDCIFGLSLIAASPAAPTKPRPIPAPNAARPNAIPAPISFEAESEPAVSSCANAGVVWVGRPNTKNIPEEIKLAIIARLVKKVLSRSVFINFRDKMPYLMITTDSQIVDSKKGEAGSSFVLIIAISNLQIQLFNVVTYFERSYYTSFQMCEYFSILPNLRIYGWFHPVFFFSKITFTFLSLTNSSRSLSSRVALMKDIASSY
jgi:hypothetical protein